MLKKIISCLLAICMLATTACSRMDKQINDSLRITVTEEEWTKMVPVVAEYKLLYPDANVEVTHFQGYMEEYKKLSTEIMSGGGADILLINSRLFPDPEKSMKAGVFADLTKFHTADESYNENEYYQSILNAGCTDFGQYIFPLSFTFPTIAGDKKILENHNINLIEPLNVEDLLKKMNQYLESDGTIPLLPDQLISGMFSPFNMMDAQNGKLSDIKLAETMQLYKTFYQTGNITYNPNGFFTSSTRIHEPLGTKYLFCNGDLWGDDFEPIYNLLAAVNNHSDPFFYPIYDFDGKINAQVTTSIAINSASPNKQNAYNFIKIARNLPGDSEIKMADGFGIKRTDLRELFNAHEDRISTGAIDSDVAVKPLGEAQIVKLQSYMDDIGNCELSGGVNTLLYGRFLPYFNDEISLDDCIAQAKSWMEIYISE